MEQIRVFKKDLVPGMKFKIKEGKSFNTAREGSIATFITMLPNSSLDNDNIGISIENFTSGHDLNGSLLPGDQSGYYVDIDFLNDVFTLITAELAKVDFESVILADDKKNQIIHALKQVDNYKLIFEDWGFGKTFEKGKGISMLFYGPPGTGKTLMAQAIAAKLGYSLKIISNADIQSSSPGEAERNIRKYFKESKGAKNVLLFDECDSLIHSRASVGVIVGSQINELLSQLERFEGVTVFTTNRLGSLDEAVNRRLSIKIEFSMPSVTERVKIWQRMFPEEAPLDPKVDWRKLAKHEIAGGHIKNAVLRAAREASVQEMDDDKKTIKMEHLLTGLKHEVESTAEFNKHKKQWEGRYRYNNEVGEEIGAKMGRRQELKAIRKSVKEMRNGES